MSTGTVVILEGITLNRASELLYGTDATTEQRTSDSASYVRCLENLIFGIVYGGTIAAGKVADVVKGVHPFKDLQKDLVGLEVDEVEADIEQAPNEQSLISDRSHQREIRRYLDSLALAARRDPNSWRALARREIGALAKEEDLDNYLPSLRTSLKDPSKYRFPGRYQFWPDKDLQESIPEAFLDLMCHGVRGLAEVPNGMSENALRAFMSRMVLAHIVIFHRYRIGFRRRYGIDDPVIHLPFATRESLVPTESDPIWRVRRYLAPRLLLVMLEDCHERKDVLIELGQHLVPLGFHKTYRTILAEAVTCFRKGRTEEADRLGGYLEEVSRDLKNPGIISLGQLDGRSNLTTVPFARLRDPINERYANALEHIFPELRMNPNRAPDKRFMQQASIIGRPTLTGDAAALEEALGRAEYIESRDRESFLQLLKALAGVANLALKEPLFPKDTSERDFQPKLLNLLTHRLGGRASDLESHPSVTGGIMDFKFRGIPCELKVVKRGSVSANSLEKTCSQIKEYAARSGSYLAILSVLDCTKKTASLDHPDNDVQWRRFDPKGGSSAIFVGIVIIRGNLPRASSLG